MSAPLLEARGLNKRFGAVVAAADLQVDLVTGERVSLVGSNGAGKTTLVNMITGYLKPDAGRILLEGRDITKLAPRAITRLGVARSFQIPQLCGDLTVLDNMLVADACHDDDGLSFWKPARRAATVERAEALPNLRSLIVSHNGTVLAERALQGARLDRPTNIKSASKTIISALVGIAIGRGVLQGTGQPIASILGPSIPSDADARIRQVTIGHLLSMQAGLERTSGGNYGAWIGSGNWVRYALSRPFVDEPGGRMLYSTGSTHLLSAALTRAAKRSTLELARDWLGEPLEITIAPWTRDPQGIFLGGNEMALSPRALHRFGEMYRMGGTIDGKRVVPESWISESWTPRTSSPFTGDRYGYGWFLREMHGHQAYYAWGFGGQMLYVIPSLGLTVTMTSDSTEPSREDNYVGQLHALVADGIVPALLPKPEDKTGSLGTNDPQPSEKPL